MSFGNIKRRKADILYSQWLRKERPRCERCYGIQSLQVSHFFGRANENLRFFPNNTDCLCFSCHQFFTRNPNAYVDWKRNRMGDVEYKRLVVEANVKKKKDDQLVIIWLNKLMGIKTKEKKGTGFSQCVHGSKLCVLCHLKLKKKGLSKSSG